MQAIVARHVLRPAMLPGATGRADAFAEARDAVVVELASLLHEVGLGPHAPRTETDHPLVLVVAPARASMIAVDADPDLGALGLRPAVGPCAGSPTLDVTATVAVTLLRLAGWDGAVETVEIAGPSDDREDHVIDAVVASALTGRVLVMIALASGEAELPAGAHPALAAAHVRVLSVADRLDAAQVASDDARVASDTAPRA